MEFKTAVQSLAALAQETRLAVYRLLVQQGPTGMAAGEIAAHLELAPATLSFHLKELAHAGLVRSRQAGRFIFYAADFDAMNALLAFLTENCCVADCGPACGPAQTCKPSSTSGARPARINRRAARSGGARTKGVKA